MSKMRKRFLPVLLAASMVCGSVSPAYAADLFSADEEDIVAESVEFTDESAVEGQAATDPFVYGGIAVIVNAALKTNFTWQQMKDICDRLGITEASELIKILGDLTEVINSKDPKKIIEFIVGLAKDSVDDKIKVPVTVNYIEDETTLDNKGKVEIPFTEVVDALQNGVSRETIEADLNTTNFGYVIVGDAASFKIEPTTDLQLNLGSLANDLKILFEGIQNGNLPFSLSVNVPVQEKVIPNITVTVTFKDLLGKVYDKLAGKTFEVAPETKTVTVDYLKQNSLIPAGYQVVPTPFVIPWRGIYNIDKNNNINVTLVRDYSDVLPDESEIEDWLKQKMEEIVKTNKITVNVHYMNGNTEEQYETININALQYLKQSLSKTEIPEVKEGWKITADRFPIKTTVPKFPQIDVSVYVPVAPTTRDVTIKFVDKDGNEIEGVSDATVEDVLSIKTTLTADEVTAELPEGYLLCVEQTFNIDKNNQVTVKIEPEIKTVRVHVFYMDKVADAIKDEVELDIEENENRLIPEEKLAIPAGYMLAEDASLNYMEDVYDITDLDFYASIKIVPETKDVTVRFVLGTENKEVGTPDAVKVGFYDSKLTVNKDTVKVPEGYVLSPKNAVVTIPADNVVIVPVAVAQKDVTIIFKTKYGETVEKRSIKVGINTKYIKVSDLTAPEKCVITSTGKAWFDNNGKTTVYVKRTTKDVTVIFKTKDGKTVESRPMEVGINTNYVKVSDLTAPKKHIIISTGKAYFDKNGKTTVWVKRATKNVTVIFKTKDGKVVETRPMEVDIDADYVKVSSLTAPEKCVITSTGNAYFDKNGKTTVWVKRTTKTVTITYKTTDGKVVTTKTQEVPANAKTVNVKAPDGYKLVRNKTVVEFNTKTNTVTVYVTRTSRNVTVYFKNINGTVVGSKDMGKINMDIDQINISKLTAPAGFTIIGKGYADIDSNGNAYVRVARSW